MDPLSRSLSELPILFAEWITPDVSARVEKLSKSPDETLKHLVRDVLPHLSEIHAHLDSFDDGQLDDRARALLGLAEVALEAEQELSSR